MLLLPEKVSGFHDPGDPPPSLFPFSILEKKCEQIDQMSEYSLVKAIDFLEEENRSYYLVLIRHFTKGHFLIFCNKYYPLVAFSHLVEQPLYQEPSLTTIEKGEIPPNEFVNLPDLEPFLKPEFTVLEKDFLAKSVNADNPQDAISVSKLCHSEFAEFSFWKPKVLSDIIFNNWG